MSALRRYVRETWSCPKCGASNPWLVHQNKIEEQVRKSGGRLPTLPPRSLFEPAIRYRDEAAFDGGAGYLEVECPRCGHVQKFATEDAQG